MDDQLKAVIASARGQLDKAILDPAIFTLIMRKLEAKRQKKRRLYFLKVSSLSGIAAILLIGFFVMFFADKTDSRMQVNVNMPDTTQLNEHPLAETYPSVDARRKELDDVKNTFVRKRGVAVPSGQQQFFLVSPASRISAIYAAEKQKKNSRALIDVLFELLKKDPNANVRIAALDVLSTKMSDVIIRKRLVYAMADQDEPMVQLMMIQLFSGTGGQDFIEQLGQMIKDPKTDGEVREEARFSYAQYTNSYN